MRNQARTICVRCLFVSVLPSESSTWSSSWLFSSFQPRVAALMQTCWQTTLNMKDSDLLMTCEWLINIWLQASPVPMGEHAITTYFPSPHDALLIMSPRPHAPRHLCFVHVRTMHEVPEVSAACSIYYLSVLFIIVDETERTFADLAQRWLKIDFHVHLPGTCRSLFASYGRHGPLGSLVGPTLTQRRRWVTVPASSPGFSRTHILDRRIGLSCRLRVYSACILGGILIS